MGNSTKHLSCIKPGLIRRPENLKLVKDRPEVRYLAAVLQMGITVVIIFWKDDEDTAKKFIKDKAIPLTENLPF